MGAVGLLALASACDASTEEAAPTITPTVEGPIEAQACPNESAAADAQQVGGTLDADFDGDGELDEASLHLDLAGEQGCRAFVVVRGSEGIVSVPVWGMDQAGGLSEPSLAFAAEVNGAEGAEIVVNEAAGASTQFVSVLTFSDGPPARITAHPEGPERWTGEADGLFPSGGSVGHVEAVDCVEPGRIVVSQAIPAHDPEVYRVVRRFYELTGPAMSPDGVSRDRVPAVELGQVPEFVGSPFGSCE